jgi:Domain of unknown function (DUF4184)
MPFTPFHMGPGLAMKALAGRHFSLVVFGVSQVLIDLEPLVRIIRGDAVLHGWTHTYVGATAIAVVAAILGRPVCQFLLDRWQPKPSWRWLAELGGDWRITQRAAYIAAFAGTYSHVLLDSLMHSDMRPWLPISDSNVLLYRVPFETVYVGCAWAGLIGAALALALSLWAARSQGRVG